MNEALFSFNNASDIHSGYAVNKKIKRSSLQWLFSDLANGNEIRRYSDKRAAGVTNDNDNNKKLENEKTTVGTSKDRNASTGGKHDGLLGSLLMESFSGAALSELMPAFFDLFDVTLVVEAVDEFWVERREASVANKPPEFTYFPL